MVTSAAIFSAESFGDLVSDNGDWVQLVQSEDVLHLPNTSASLFPLEKTEHPIPYTVHYVKWNYCRVDDATLENRFMAFQSEPAVKCKWENSTIQYKRLSVSLTSSTASHFK